MLRWPADAARRDELAERRLPRLLLVAEGVLPPRLDPDEDWIRTPAGERDVWARLRALADRHDERRRQHPEAGGGTGVAPAQTLRADRVGDPLRPRPGRAPRRRNGSLVMRP